MRFQALFDSIYIQIFVFQLNFKVNNKLEKREPKILLGKEGRGRREKLLANEEDETTKESFSPWWQETDPRGDDRRVIEERFFVEKFWSLRRKSVNDGRAIVWSSYKGEAS